MTARARKGRVRSAAILGTVVISAMVFAATGASGQSPAASAPAGEAADLRFGWWGGDARHALTNSVIDLFEAQNPGVTITGEPTDFTSYWERLAVQSAAGDAPDILNMHVNNLVKYAQEGVLAPLEPFIESGDLDVSGLSEGFLAGGKVDGVQYMIPMGSPYMSTIFDQDALTAAGLEVPPADYTWDDFFQLLRDWATATGGEAPWPTQNMVDSEQHFYSWLLGQGLEPFTSEGKIGWTEADLARWYTLWKEMQDIGATPPMDVQVEEASDTIEDSMMTKGRVLMEARPSNQLATFQDLLDSQLNVIGLPAGPAGPGNVMLPAGIGVYTGSANQDVVARFISYWINDIEAGVTYKADQGVPGVAAQRDAMLASGELPDAQRRVFELFGELDFASMSALPGNAQQFIDAFAVGFEPVGFGASPEEGAAQLVAALPAEMKP